MKPSIDQLLRKAASLSARRQDAEAAEIYRAILARFPANRKAQDGLAALAPRPSEPSDGEVQQLLALYRQGRLGDVIALAAALITVHPGSVFLHNIAGAAQAGAGQIEAAVASYDAAIALKPDFAAAYSNRGLALLELQRFDDALASLDRAISLDPGDAETHSNRGSALQKMGRADDALAGFDMAIALAPLYAEAHGNRGILLKDMGRLDEARDAIDRAIALKPDFAAAHSNRGLVMLALGRPDEAVADSDRAIALNPGFAEAHCNRGVALFALGRPQDAIDSYDAAIALRPGHGDAHYNRGNALQELKRLDAALDAYRSAVACDAGQAEAANQIVYLQARLCDWSGDAPPAPCPEQIARDAVTPFAMLIAEDDAARHLLRSQAFSARRHGHARAAPAFAAATGARLKIGYFSADFHDHATMYLMARLFELHDKSRFEVHAFSYGPAKQDAMRARLVDAVDAFHDVPHLDDGSIAALSRQQGIDIAVDLKGHTQHARSGLFAHRAAPVQIAYLGYPGSMGADFIDYMIADPVVIPAGHRRFYSEKIIALPDSYQVNDEQRAIADGPADRAAHGLPEDGFVFCSFNNNYKIAPDSFDIWMQLLAKVDGSVLWLLNDNVWAEANLRREAGARGIDPARLVFAGRAALPEHLARHRCADLFLDTFNVNAHTTASDALWAGLPVLTRLGDSFASRVAGSLLHAVGLPELVTGSAAAYEALALDLATDGGRLAALRDRLAANRSTMPLFDTARFARHIERAYELAHARYRDGLAPDHIDVPAEWPAERRIAA